MSEDSEQANSSDLRIRTLAAKRAQEIVLQEGTALALSARQMDENAMGANSHALAVAIAQAIVNAYDGDLGEEVDT